MLVALVWLLPILLYAHQTSLTPGGKELFWVNPSVPLVIRTNTTDLTSAQVNAVIANSMAQWNASSSAKVYPSLSAVNEIRFVSNFPYGSGVVGLTEVSYNSAGAIENAVISLNDDYVFHASEGTYGYKHIFLGDVVTHELGHFLGLAHSEVLNASMFYANFPGQNTVALDDRTGVKQKYDSANGKITGQVKGGRDIGILGVHVQAISRKTGEVTSTVTDVNGNFSLGGLSLNDTYYLYTSPIKKIESLPGSYSNTQTQFCPASYVGSFFSACGRTFDGKPQSLNLTNSHSSLDVGTVSINCSLRSDEAYSVQKLQTTPGPVVMFDYRSELRSEKSFVGWFRKPIDESWSPYDTLVVDLSAYSDLSGSSKYLKVSLVSYPFGNQLQYQMFVEQNGTVVPSASRALVGPLSNGTYSTDFEALIPLSSSQEVNVYNVNIRAKKLDATIIDKTFPAAAQFTTEEHMPYLIVASVWEQTPDGIVPVLDTASNLSDNSQCLDAPFTYAVAQAQSTEAAEDNKDRDQTGLNATCATIEPPGSGPTSSLPLMTLGFLLSFILSTAIKSRKKFLY